MSGHATSPPAPTFPDKAALYAWLERQVGFLIDGMNGKFTPQANLVIGLGNVAALCFYELNRYTRPDAVLQNLPVNWFGFYLLQAPGVLALGPFQGRPACTEIRIGKGVCGTAAEQARTLVVRDVHDFPGHIACDSASDAEVVVPILSENGAVLGVIDVDSTIPGHFDEEDGRGLEAIARVLVKHLEFPMARVLAVNPALATPSFSVVTHGGMMPAPPVPPAMSDGEPAPPPPPPTRVMAGSGTAIPFFTIEAARPDTAVKVVRNWEFTTTRLNRIMNQSELQELEGRLGITAFPEIQFPFNTIVVTNHSEDGSRRLVLAFDAVAVLADAAVYYHSTHFKEVNGQLTIPVSEAWATSSYDRHDPKVDWAWRHRYFGVPTAQVADRLHPLPAGSPGINWNLLKDRSLPIVFYDAFDLFEDDLHDHGMVTCSIKFRVMDAAFFILFRHAVRVDGHALWIREVRFYHEFAWAVEAAAEDPPRQPHVVVQEQVRKLSIAGSAGGQTTADWKDLSLDDLAQKAEVLSSEDFYLTI